MEDENKSGEAVRYQLRSIGAASFLLLDYPRFIDLGDLIGNLNVADIVIVDVLMKQDFPFRVHLQVDDSLVAVHEVEDPDELISEDPGTMEARHLLGFSERVYAYLRGQ